MAVSTLPAAKSALHARISAITDLATDGVSFEWDQTAQIRTGEERIYLFDTIDHERDWASLGQQNLEETYTMQVVIDTFRYADEREACELRLWELIGLVESAVRADITLDQTVRQTRCAGVDSRMEPTDEGWIASAIVRLTCSARI